jgi:hypothetical protein
MLLRFQEGKLRIEDQEWHRLVPEEAQGVLGKKEVRRQSVIFEIIKGERDYVNDLELVQQVGPFSLDSGFMTVNNWILAVYRWYPRCTPSYHPRTKITWFH